MWTIPRISGATLVVVLLLRGCVPTPAPTSQTPRPTATPVFASEAEALAAATKAYAEYVRVSDEITADGGQDPQRIAPYVTAAQLTDELRGFKSYSDRGYSTAGESTFDNVSLQGISESLPRGVVIYVCSDVTKVRILNSERIDVTPATRMDRQAFEVTFQTNPVKKGQLLLARNETWPNAGICP